MRRRASSTLVFAAAAVAAGGCSSIDVTWPDDTGPGPSDARSRVVLAEPEVRSARREHPQPDAGDDSADGLADAARPMDDASRRTAPAAVVLETGPEIFLQGVTDDGYVIYLTPYGVSGVPVAGGAPTLLMPVAGIAAERGIATLVEHDVVFVWSAITEAGVGTLGVWTHAQSSVAQVATASIVGLGAVSTDSSDILFTDDAADDARSASLFALAVAPGGAPVRLAIDIDTERSACGYPALAFTGTAPAVGVASFCSPGAAAAELYAYSSEDWAPVALATNVVNFLVDGVGARAAVVVGGGQLEIATLPGASGAPLLIDGMATQENAAVPPPEYFLSATDDFVLYAAQGDGALTRSPVTMDSPTPLTMYGVFGIDGVSPDETWALVNFAASDVVTPFSNDLSLASLDAAGTPVNVALDTATGIVGDAFTRDSAYAIFMTDAASIDVANVAANTITGVLTAVSVANPRVRVTLSSQSIAWVGSSPDDVALHDSVVVYADDFQRSLGQVGLADLCIIDLASGAPSSLVAERVDPDFAVSSDRQYVVYTVKAGDGLDGLYSVRAPL